MTPQRHRERHRVKRVGWLRAAVLGANDGIVSTASLLVGVAAADASHGALLTAGIAGAVAGAMSMAAGEYVSVSSQADSEKADLAREQSELATDDAGERRELMGIYIGRGLSHELAPRVADELMAHDALGAHARDELGITDLSVARPLQAAGASASSFACGALLPLAVAASTPVATALWAVPATALFFLASLGAVAARAGGAAIGVAAARVTFWGALAMAATAGIGQLFGTIVQ
jgi:VIT1/CCC1 family predicted Fe2+/Mn2+ transporter